MIDPSIPLSVKPIQAPDSVGSLGQLMQLQGGMQQMRLGDLQYAKIMQGLIDDQATKQAYGAYLRDPNGISLATLGEKNPKLAEEILKAQREQKKTDSEIEKNNAETEFKRYEVASKTAERRANILSGAKDQATYDLARSALVQEFGPSVIAQLPERFDPALVQSRVAEGMSLKDRLEREAADKRFAWEQGSKAIDQQTARFTAESGRISANASVTSASAAQTSAGAAVANARTARDRLTFDQNTPNLHYDAERGVLVNTRTAATTPAVDASGTPLGRQPQKPNEQYLKQQTGVENVKSAIDEYRKALGETNLAQMMTPSVAARLGTLYNNMMLQSKEAYNLGVLNGPDYSILQKLTPDPTSLRGIMTFNSTMDSQLGTLKDIMTNIGKTSARVHQQPEPAPDPAKFGLTKAK